MEMFNVKRRDNPSMDNWSDIKKPAFGGPKEKADFDKAKKTKLKEYQRIVERNPDAEGGRFNPNYDSAWKGFTSDIIYRTAKKKSYEPMYSTPTIAVINAIEEGNIIRFEEFINENMSNEDEFDEYGNRIPAKFNPDSDEPVEYLEEDEDEVDTFDEFEEEEKVDLGYEVDEEQLDKLLEEFGDELQTMITNICETMEMEKSEVCDLLCAAIEKKCNEEDSEEDTEEDTEDNGEDIEDDI
jgi:hypothetical protein